MTDEKAIADRIVLKGVRVHRKCRAGKERLWLSPKHWRELLTPEEIADVEAHRAGLLDLARAGFAPRIPEDPTPQAKQAEAAALACPQCYRAPCIGADHVSFDLLHPDHEITVARRKLADAKQIYDRLLHRAMGAPI